MRLVLSIIIFMIYIIPAISYSVYSNHTSEARYCGLPKRDSSGAIIRSYSVYTSFRKLYPCPSTGLTTGSCPGWQVDHVIPLASCACDSLINLQWLPVEIKTCKQPYCKDRFERNIYRCKPEDQ